MWVYFERKRWVIHGRRVNNSFYTCPQIINPGTKRLLLVSGKIIKPKINHYVSSRIRLFTSFLKTLWAWIQKMGQKVSVRDLKWDKCTHNACQKHQLVHLPITASRGFLQPPPSLLHAQGLIPKVLGHYSKAGPQQLNTWHGPNNRNLSWGSRYQQWIQDELSKWRIY